MVLTAAIGLAACSAPAEDHTTPGAPSPESGALPVTIEHNYGSTTISKPVTRVAAMGVGDADTLLALGFRPVAAAPFGSPANVRTPWNEKLLGSDEPVALPEASQQFGNEIAKALSTDPDLVTAVGAAPTKEQYAKLAAAVPTITRPANHPDWQVPWDVQATEIGRAVGRPGAVAAKIGETSKHVAGLAAAHPELKDKTAVAVTASPDGTISIFGPGDGRQQILASYGLRFPDGLKSAVTSGFYGSIAPENIGLLNQADVVVVLDWQGANDQIRKNSAWNAQPFVTGGRTVYLDQEVGTAMGVPTVLSIPWIADQSIGRIATAAGRAG
ncbi:ABC transporter substrate-binding protein [Gordonia sp. DT219]|uniref:ABC transporter substrate-binding protein n=1 Tax=Gordonia sp. DT219 TaxID=3416658 RepID=UPI003CF32DB0